MVTQMEGVPSRAEGRIAIVAARYNEQITQRLLDGALATLAEHAWRDNRVVVARVPGAWEVPIVVERLAQSGHFAAIIALAAVIRGETPHDQYINEQVSHALAQTSVNSGVPVLFGLLTCLNLEQAIHRSGGKVGNKGSECALAALEMIDLLAQLP